VFINPKLKLLGHLDRVAGLRDRVLSPVNVEIDLSNRCQLHCDWCDFKHVQSGYGNTGDLIDADRIINVIEAETNIRSITWSGGGEPLMHPEIGWIILSVNVDQGIYTNGIGIDRSMALLLKRTMTWVYVSLDCPDRKSYREMKGRGFKEACKGIKELSRADGRATVGVGFLINGDNCSRMGEMLVLGQKLGADYVQFRPMIQTHPDSPSDITESTEWVAGCMLELMKFQGLPGVEIDVDRFKMYYNWRGHGYSTCWWSGLQTVITPDCKVWTCCNKRGTSLLGDLHEEDFSSIWARRPIAEVDKECRVLCRGHIPNLTLTTLMERAEKHCNFI
jgi:MoaA/NifB/PqqE/SkfB family radical SAM enzyme